MSEPRMKVQYNTEIAPSLMKKFGYKSVMQIPKLDKVVINVAVTTFTHVHLPRQTELFGSHRPQKDAC